MPKAKKMSAERIAIAIHNAGYTMESIADIVAGLEAEAKRRAAPVPRARTTRGEGPTISRQDQIAGLTPGIYRVANETGLYLKKGDNDTGSWFRRFWCDGRRHEMGFGALAKVTLLQARVKATAFDDDRNANNDPLAERRAARAARHVEREAARAAKQATSIVDERWNFEHATEEYLRAFGNSWKHPRAVAVWHNPLRKYAYPLIGRMLLDDITVDHVAAVMDAAIAGKAPKVAPRIRQRIEQILAAATTRGKRADTPNPADVRKIKTIRPMPKKKQRPHFRRLDRDQAPEVFQKLRELARSSTPRSAVCFMILTAARPSEALCATWDEIDLDKALWTIPAERMKGGREHVVPLSPIAIEILERQAGVRTGNAIFPGRGERPLSYTQFAVAAKSVKLDIGSLHGWRSVFADWSREVGGIKPEVREASLAHVLSDVVGSYVRETMIQARAKAMTRYADWLTGKTKTGKVLELTARQKAVA
jgi:integrase